MAYGSSVDLKLRQIAELIDAGQKKEARKLLREILDADRRNLSAWELLWRAVYSVKEELICLNHILAINPDHAPARRRMDDIRLRGEAASTTGELFNTAPFIQDSPTSQPPPARRPPPPRRNKKKKSNLVLFLILLLLPTVCAGVLGFAFYRAGYLDSILFASNLTATAVSEKNASCQALIEKAMQASGSYCNEIGSNKACYGNNTINADLEPGTEEQFSERGDIIDVGKVRRISASPLRLDSNEWGIAVFKVIANLPRSLPGQTITMVVFGNTTLDNQSGNLESFFFSSELGQIVCDRMPEDGILITVPDGDGVTFNVNGAELTLMGDATIKAVKNGKMEVSLFEGSGRIVSDGQEQYFGAGEQVSVPLGGENGNESVGPPSTPESLSQEDLDTACALTGQFCDQDQITPVPSEQVQQQIMSGLGITPTPTATSLPTSTITRTPTKTITPTISKTPLPSSTSTFWVLPSWTPTRTATPIHTSAPVATPTRTRTPSRTPTRTPTPTVTSTPTITSTPTDTATATETSTPTATHTNTPVPAACSDVSAGSLTNSPTTQLNLPITNDDGGQIILDELHVEWIDPPSQRISEILLDGNSLNLGNDNASPSDYPSEQSWDDYPSEHQINDTATKDLVINFDAVLDPGLYYVKVTFNIGCYVEADLTLP